MESTYKIIWTDEALDNLSSIIEYLEYRWTKREIQNFVNLLDRQIIRIQINPELFQTSFSSSLLRRSVLTKQITIYYSIDKNEVRIVSLFDNRQNPKRLKTNK